MLKSSVSGERERERCLLICISLSVAPVAGALPLSFITTVQYSTRTRSNLSNPKRRAAVHATYCLLFSLPRCNSSSVVSAHRACRHQLTPLALRYITLLHFPQTRDRLHPTLIVDYTRRSLILYEHCFNKDKIHWNVAYR